MGSLNRRDWLGRAAWTFGALVAGGCGRTSEPATEDRGTERLEQETFDFIERCRREDGGYAPSPDPSYKGTSDTRLSDLAAVTYAAILARTCDRHLPHADQSVSFIQAHQQPDGSFVHKVGEHPQGSDLATLYNTTQGTVGLHALGESPRKDPRGILERFFAGGAYRKLPWYTTSFFPLLYAALHEPFPAEYRKALMKYQEDHQESDGYLGDHVAATFHMAHFYRLIGQQTPRAEAMVERVLRDQTQEGGWNIKEPSWDVHACFDAVFILHQLGGKSTAVRNALDRAAAWALSCRNGDGGFGHFPKRPSDMDAIYFQMSTLFQTGYLRMSLADPADAHTLGWGHAMEPGRVYGQEEQPTPGPHAGSKP